MMSRAWLVALIGLAACSRAPYTARFSGGFDTEDRAIVKRGVVEYRARQRPSTNAVAIARLAGVTRGLVAAAETGPGRDRAKGIAWEFVLVDSPDTTLVTFPDGTIFVAASLLRVLPTDDALAGVIGQAVARVLLVHGAEVARQRATGRELLGLYPMSEGSSRVDLADRQTEEADYVGLVLAVDAGYDPDRAVVLFDLLGLRDRGRQAEKHLPELRARRATPEAPKPE